MSTDATGFQPRDDQSIDEAVQQAIERRIRDRIDEDNNRIEAFVRQLIQLADDALAGGGEHPPEDILETTHFLLRQDPRLDELLHPTNDRLDAAVKYQFREQKRLRDAGTHPPAEHEHATLVQIAKQLEYIHAYSDKTRYAPVRFERLDVQGGASSTSGALTPIGRKRIGSDQKTDIDDVAPSINHDDCEHVMAVALPRQGKDSMIASMCANLKTEHGYKWFSCFDDGRNETPMVAIPSDDPDIRENLAEFGQQPQGYDTVVYVPATSGLPSTLPSNFEPFTIGIDDLTPKLILQLAGVSTDDSNTMRRVGQALSQVQQKSGEVEQLVGLLKEYADEVEATITVSEIADDEFNETEDGHEVVADAAEVEESGGDVREMHYEMDADDVLEDCADALMMLAGEGLIADAGASTNLDIEAEFRKDRVAVLNCNFLLERNEVLKYLVLNLWLRLIFQARDDNPRLPRAALEIRELKNIAPSKLGQTDHRKPIKSIRNTLYEIATQGGSRRVMMLGSTQKLNEVSKAIRTNMPIKVLLQLGKEEIQSLDRSYDFSPRQEQQLESFQTGWGMLLAHGERHWPIQWRGAPCGLGLGDSAWRDRYAKAWGARVREYDGDGWVSDHREKDCWIDCFTGRVSELDLDEDNAPEFGQWHLFGADLPDDVDVTPGDEVDGEAIADALHQRREYPVPSDLSLTSVESAATRQLSFVGAERAQDERKNRVLQEHDVPRALGHWIGAKEDMRQKMMWVMQALKHDEDKQLTSHAKIGDRCDIPTSTVRYYINDDEKLGQCVTTGASGAYRLTNVGEAAMEVNWEKLDDLV